MSEIPCKVEKILGIVLKGNLSNLQSFQHLGILLIFEKNLERIPMIDIVSRRG